MAVDVATEDTNLILLLGLDPYRGWMVAEVKSQLDQKKREWNRLKTGVGPRANDAMRRLNILKKLDTEAILVTQAGVDGHIAEAREARSKKQKQDEDSLRDEIRFAASKGYLLPAEAENIRNRYRERVSPEYLEARLREKSVETHESSETISQLTLDQIDEALTALNERSLYSFLGLSQNASSEQLVHAADEKAEEARKHPVGDLKYDHQKNLAGHARAVFSEDAKRAQYDNHDREARFIVSVLAPYIPLCELTKEITLQQAEYLLERAREAKWGETEAQQLLFTIAVSKGWRMQVPASRRAETTAAQQRVVDELKKALAEAREEKAEAERREVQARKDRDAAKSKAEKAARELLAARKEYEDRQRHIEEMQKQLSKVEQDRIALRRAKVQDQERLNNVSAKYEELQRELQQAQALQREEDQARVAEFGPRLTAHLVRGELVAAQAIIRSFVHIPPQWDNDERRVADGIRDATHLLEEAKRVAGSDLHRAEQLLDSALSKCADMESALEFRRQLPPAPPSDLQVVADGQGISLSWQSSPSRNVRYVVVRTEGGKPASIYDGDQIAKSTATRWRDEAPPPARALWYAVYSERDETASTSGTIAKRALFFVPDVADLRCDVGDGQITLLWRSPEKVNAVLVVRRESTAPRGLEDGKRYEVGRSERLADSDVQNGARYFYRVYCEYLDATDAVHYSEGQLIDAIPEPPPQEVPALEVRGNQGFLNHTVTLVAAAPTHGELRVYRSDEAPHVPPSKTVPVHALQAVFGRTGRPLAEMRDTLFAAAHAFYTPVVLFHDTAFLGDPREYSYGPRLTNVRTETAEHSIRVCWRWSYGCEGAEVYCTPYGVPATNPHVEYVTRTASNEADPYIELRTMARGTYDIAVRARYQIGGRVVFSDLERVTAHLGGPLVIRYTVRAQHRVFGGKQYQVVLSASEPVPYPPPCIVVRSEERAPANPSDGELVPTPAAQRRDDGTWVIPLDGFVPRLNTALALFPVAAQLHDIRFEPESPDAQRIA